MKPAGTPDDLARNEFAVAGAEGVHDPAGGDAGADKGRQVRDGGLVGLPGRFQQGIAPRVVLIGQRHAITLLHRP
jgi:hypothetical protein